jgi:hypothetical protein
MSSNCCALQIYDIGRTELWRDLNRARRNRALAHRLPGDLRATLPDLGGIDSRQRVAYGINHLDLLSRPEVYAQIRQWLAESG